MSLLLLVVAFSAQPGHAQLLGRVPEATPLLQEGAVVHRRITMLARRVQRDVRDSRRYGAQRRFVCLNDVLSDLHSTQRALESWTDDIRRAEAIPQRLRGMLAVYRLHLKELRAEALGCFGAQAASASSVKVTISEDQPDEDPHRVPQPNVRDVPWSAPRR